MYVIHPFFVYPAEGSFYCYVTESGAVVQVEKELHTILEQLMPLTGKAIEVADLRRVGLTSEDSDELLKYGLISPLPGSVGGDAIPDYSQAPIVNITVILSSRCNLACKYCYARHEAESPRDMPSEIGRKTIDFLLTSSNGKLEVHVTFFGGEPLLNFPVLKDMVEYGEEMAQQYHKRIAFSLTTNGTLLDPEVVTFLDRHQVSVTVSIDGHRLIHDSLRPRSNGKGSYDALVEKLANLTHYYRCRLPMARITVSNRALSLHELFDHVHSLGFTRIGLSPLAEFDGEYGIDAYGLDRYMEEFNKLAGRFLIEARAGRLLGFANLINLLQSIHKGETKTHSCGAGIGMISVDPYGKIYTCHRLIGIDAFLMGNIHSGVDQAKRLSFLKEGTIYAKARCRLCWARNLCGGGCHYENSHRGGLSSEPPEFVCRFYRSTVTTCLKVYAMLRENNPSLFSYLMGEDSLDLHTGNRLL